jgi:2-polyprenyl-3-methyl-5-hydroxy-6-metoxy-1,4-benzoquinol methylase
MVDAKLSSELTYQRERAMQQEVRATDNLTIERYRASRWWRLFNKEFIFKSMGDLRGKAVLDFGCGEGNLGVQIGSLGAQVLGIDISPELIDLARRRAELDHVSGHVDFQASDILETQPPAESFDFVVCTDALHHVDLPRVVGILHRCLKPGGALIVKEPVSFSKTFQTVRERLPIEIVASPGDRQLMEADLEDIRRPFASSEIVYFNFLGRFSRFLPNSNRIDRGHPITKAVMLALLGLDRIVISAIPFVRRYCGEVVIVARKAS